MNKTVTKRSSATIAATVIATTLLFGVTTAAFAQDYNNSNGDENRNATGKIFDAELLGSNELPTVTNSPTSGYSGVWFGSDGQGMNYWLYVYNGDEIKAAHMHCGDSGENGPVVVGLYEESGGSDVNGWLAEGDIGIDDIADTGTDCSGTIGYDIENLDDLARAIEEGKIYTNVHSDQYPNGVARGQLAFRENTSDDDNGNDTNGYYNHNDHWDNQDYGDKDWMSHENNDWYNGDWNYDSDNENRWNDDNDWEDENWSDDAWQHSYNGHPIRSITGLRVSNNWEN